MNTTVTVAYQPSIAGAARVLQALTSSDTEPVNLYRETRAGDPAAWCEYSAICAAGYLGIARRRNTVSQTATGATAR